MKDKRNGSDESKKPMTLPRINGEISGVIESDMEDRGNGSDGKMGIVILPRINQDLYRVMMSENKI